LTSGRATTSVTKPAGPHGGADNLVRIVDAQSIEDVAFLPGHAGAVFALAFSPDGKTLASGGRDGQLRLWNTTAWQEMAVMAHHQVDLDPGVQAVEFNASGSLLYSAGARGRVIVWEAAIEAAAGR